MFARRSFDFRRFANPRQLMAYLGLVPSEHSSGSTIRRGGITKAGNALARRALIEGAWSTAFASARPVQMGRGAQRLGAGRGQDTRHRGLQPRRLAPVTKRFVSASKHPNCCSFATL